MPNFAKIIHKALGKAEKITRSLEEPRVTYTPTSKTGQVRQWIETKVAALVPVNAASVTFVAQKGFLKHSSAFEGHFRRFEVMVASFSPEDEGRQNRKSPYEAAITIEIGYPDAPNVKVGSSIYAVADLKSDDDEQLDGLLRGEGFFDGLTGAGATVKSLESVFDLGSTVRRHRYIFRAVRTWA